MTILTDGQRTVGIQMNFWTGTGFTPDWSNDFFDVGILPKTDDDEDIFIVDDVRYCIEQAKDWWRCTGDFRNDDVSAEPGERSIHVTWFL